MATRIWMVVFGLCILVTLGLAAFTVMRGQAVTETRIIQTAAVDRDRRVVAEAPPGATCRITYITPAGNRSISQALQGERTVDFTGRIEWNWTVLGTSPGTGRITVSCVPGGEASRLIETR